MAPTFFTDQFEFRAWLEANHKTATEMLVGYYKVDSGIPSLSWSESVDQAICFGWIDGVRRSIDEKSYCIRFTPRKPTSNWSTVNLKKVEELTDKGLMQAAGFDAFNKRREDKSGIYSFENEVRELPPDYKNKFRANLTAWTYFSNLAKSYQRTIIHWMLSAKQEKTRLDRLDKTIMASEQQRRVI